jgi:hypothetical protein
MPVNVPNQRCFDIHHAVTLHGQFIRQVAQQYGLSLTRPPVRGCTAKTTYDNKDATSRTTSDDASDCPQKTCDNSIAPNAAA